MDVMIQNIVQTRKEINLLSIYLQPSLPVRQTFHPERTEAAKLFASEATQT